MGLDQSRKNIIKNKPICYVAKRQSEEELTWGLGPTIWLWPRPSIECINAKIGDGGDSTIRRYLADESVRVPLEKKVLNEDMRAMHGRPELSTG